MKFYISSEKGGPFVCLGNNEEIKNNLRPCVKMLKNGNCETESYSPIWNVSQDNADMVIDIMDDKGFFFLLVVDAWEKDKEGSCGAYLQRCFLSPQSDEGFVFVADSEPAYGKVRLAKVVTFIPE